MSDIEEISECRLCKSPNINLVIDLGKTPLANALVSKENLDKPEFEAPLRVCRCLDCGCVFLKDTVNPEILFKNYLYASSTSASLRKHFEDYAESVVNQWRLKPGDLVIEIASNDNILLKPFKKLGMNVVGIEPAENIVEASKEDGIKTYNEFFCKELAERMVDEVGLAKVITANNVLAHVPNLESIVKGIKLLLAPDGIFIFQNAYLLDTVNKGLLGQIYHEHCNYLSIKPLKEFFKQFDLEIVKVERNDTQEGSFRCYVKHSLCCRLNWSSAAEAIKMEQDAGLYSDEAYKSFKTKIDINKERTKELLSSLLRTGHSIAGYSHPAKAVTISCVYEIGNYFSFIVDDAKLKQGRFSPRYHVPIIGKEEFLKLQPDYAVILASNFAEFIIKNNPEFKGKWIILEPEIRIYDKL